MIPSLAYEPDGGSHPDMKSVVIYKTRRQVQEPYGSCKSLQPRDFSLLTHRDAKNTLRKEVGVNVLYSLQKGRDSPYSVDSSSQVATYFTHWHIWNTIIKYSWAVTLVIEEEHLRHYEHTVLPEGFGFDMIVLGWSRGFGHGGGPLRLSQTGFEGLVRMGSHGGIPHGISGYIISLEGAKKLCEYALPMILPLDTYVYTRCKTDDSFSLFLRQPPLIREAPSVKPVVQELEGEISLHNVILYIMGAFLLLCIGIIMAGTLYFFHSGKGHEIKIPEQQGTTNPL